LDELDTHIYAVGKTDKGKSKFLEGLLWQFITMGHDCGVIDPHGDLANNTLKLLATAPQGPSRAPWLDDPDNAEKVVYCEPGRSDIFHPHERPATHQPMTLSNCHWRDRGFPAHLERDALGHAPEARLLAQLQDSPVNAE
jgi:hypothetical protein